MKISDETISKGAYALAEAWPSSNDASVLVRAVLEAVAPDLTCSCPHISEVDEYCPQHGRPE